MNDLLIKFILSAGTLFIMFNIAGLLTWVERKQSASCKTASGPTVLPFLVLRPWACSMRWPTCLRCSARKNSFLQEPINSCSILAPYLSVTFALVGFAAIPIGGELIVNGHSIQLQAANLNIALIFIFAMMSMGVYGVVLAGFLIK